MAFCIACVLPVGATLVVFASAVAASSQHALHASAATSNLIADPLRTMSFPSLRCVRGSRSAPGAEHGAD
jgi:hypothetical protein